MGKRQLLRRLVTPLAMDRFLFGPVQEQATMVFEELPEFGGVEGLDQTGFLFADDIEIHQRQVDLRQVEFAAHQPAIDFSLCPVQLTVVGRLLAQVAAVGLDLFQAVLPGVIAIRPAPDRQALKRTFESDFTLVAITAP
ncbi:hypothetical protein D3C76_1228480 [compost metagenome]